MQLVGLCVALSEDFDHIVEIACFSCLELHAHLDREAGGDTAYVLVLAVEAGVARLCEHYAAHVFSDVADSHRHLIVLVWFNIYI